MDGKQVLELKVYVVFEVGHYSLMILIFANGTVSIKISLNLGSEPVDDYKGTHEQNAVSEL